jgi:DNA-binding NtrC family response regulator
MDKPILLLIEDEALLALPLEAALGDAGFDVVVSQSGQDSLAHLEADAARFVGIITDIRLPQVDGWTIATRARELVPTMPVVYMSGDSAPDWASKGVPGSVMLAKPFAIAQLTEAVARLINEVPPT